MTAEDYNNSIIEMITQDYIDLANEQSNDEAIRFQDLDDAIIGTDQNGLLVYDYHQMVVAFIRNTTLKTTLLSETNSSTQ